VVIEVAAGADEEVLELGDFKDGMWLGREAELDGCLGEAQGYFVS
jgi:hypothetical protein